MTIQIGFVGCRGSDSFALGETVRPLLPPGCDLVLLTIPEAKVHIASRELTLLIIAVDSDSWRESLVEMVDLQSVGERQKSVVFSLVPRDDPSALVKAFDLGVADVAGLPIDVHEVRARLAVLLRRRQVAAARAAEMQAAWQLAVFDPVTGLHNRQHLQAILPASVDSAHAGNRPLGVLVVDLDALKSFNDRWGHAAGDRMLRCVADTLVANVRPSDTVARLGGDEMVVVLPDTDAEAAAAIAAQLVDAVARKAVSCGQSTVSASVSIGLAMLAPGDDAEAVLGRADSALYRAKKEGRNRVAA